MNTKPTKTSINLIIASEGDNKYETLVNAGPDYYDDCIPVGLYTKILDAVYGVVKDWNNNSSNALDTTLGRKTIAQRADEYATQLVGGRYTKGHLGELWQDLRYKYIEIATEQKAIDDEEYRKDMRYVGVKREELIDNVLDTTIQYLQDHLIDVVLVGEDKQSGACGYRIHDERIKYDVKQQINKILNE